MGNRASQKACIDAGGMGGEVKRIPRDDNVMKMILSSLI